MIETSIKKVENGRKVANETAGALDNIVKGVGEVSSLINQIAAASDEQATAIEQINQGIIEVSQVVQDNSATSEESAAASEELSRQAFLMEEQVVKFKLRKDINKKNINNENINPELLKTLQNY